jgi:hypothetical protein
MKTNFFAALALAAALLIGTPAFAKDHGGNKGKGKNKGNSHVEVKRHGNAHRGGGAAVIKKREKGHPERVAVARSRGPVSREFISNGKNGRYRYQSAYSRNGYNNNYPGRYAFASRPGWDRRNEYNWNGNRYRWYNNGWFIVTAPVIATAPAGVAYGGGSPVSVQVQSALSQQGYYRGPIDGIVGPGTRSAIAAYQQDNNLAVTGTITDGLLNDLGM